ncbi:hypothetical protein HUU40_14810, partial [candidate division KSB1 bacterium]|nr:hypothetical protein [candidate division KSB1 bacterium]
MDHQKPVAASILQPASAAKQPAAQGKFTTTALVRKKKRTEMLAKIVFLVMTLLMITPLLLIIGYLFYQAAPILSLDFLVTNPMRGMRAGGIWAPLLGTIYLVGIS